ncbi:hypothetical protein GCM10026983_33740 [Gracilibacillus alcaliphilus]
MTYLKFGAGSWTWLFLNKNVRMKNYILSDPTKNLGNGIPKFLIDLFGHRSN